MTYRVAASTMLSAALLSSAGAAWAGCADEEAFQIRVPFLQQGSGVGESKTMKALERCMASQPVCLLLQDGKVIAGAKQAQVRIDRQAVVFAFVQEAQIGREAGAETYCAVAALDPHMADDDPQWVLQTFTPERGWSATASREDVTRPMTSSEVFGRLNRKLTQAKRERRDEDIPACGWLPAPDSPAAGGVSI